MSEEAAKDAAEAEDVVESGNQFEISVVEESASLAFISQDENTCVFIENGVRETLNFAFDNKAL